MQPNDRKTVTSLHNLPPGTAPAHDHAAERPQNGHLAAQPPAQHHSDARAHPAARQPTPTRRPAPGDGSCSRTTARWSPRCTTSRPTARRPTTMQPIDREMVTSLHNLPPGTAPAHDHAADRPRDGQLAAQPPAQHHSDARTAPCTRRQGSLRGP